MTEFSTGQAFSTGGELTTQGFPQSNSMFFGAKSKPRGQTYTLVVNGGAAVVESLPRPIAIRNAAANVEDEHDHVLDREFNKILYRDILS